MKPQVLVVSLLLLTLVVSHPLWASDADAPRDTITIVNDNTIQIKKVGHAILFRYKHAKVDEMALTRRGSLFIDGEEITLNRKERELARELYDAVLDLRREARAIGVEAAIFSKKVTVQALSIVARTLTAGQLQNGDEPCEHGTEKSEEKLDQETRAFEKRVQEAIVKKLNRVERLHNELARHLGELPEITLYKDE